MKKEKIKKGTKPKNDKNKVKVILKRNESKVEFFFSETSTPDVPNLIRGLSSIASNPSNKDSIDNGKGGKIELGEDPDKIVTK